VTQATTASRDLAARWVILPARIATMCGLSLLLAVGVNAVSPAGIAWDRLPVSAMERDLAAMGVETVSTSQAQAVLQAGTHLVLDARQANAFAMGHLPGAISCPADDASSLALFQPLLSHEQPILVYCSSSSCDDAQRLAEQLVEQGCRHVTVYVGGVRAWQAAGLILVKH